MVTDGLPVLAGLLESVTETVTGKAPPAVGVPVTTQLAPSVRPAGRVPALSEQV